MVSVRKVRKAIPQMTATQAERQVVYTVVAQAALVENWDGDGTNPDRDRPIAASGLLVSEIDEQQEIV